MKRPVQRQGSTRTRTGRCEELGMNMKVKKLVCLKSHKGYHSTPSVCPVVIVPALIAGGSLVRSIVVVGAVVIVRAVRRVRHVVFVRAGAPEAGATLEVRLGARPTLEIRVATHGSEMRWARGEVMRRQVGREMVVVVVARRERPVGTRAGVPVELLLDGVLIMAARRRLPVNGLHAVFKRARRPELPLANDSPDETCGTN